MAYKTPDGTWRATARVNGRRRTKNFRTKALAEAWERSRRDGIPDIPKRKKIEQTLSESFSAWSAKRGEVELADSTIVSLKSRWKLIEKEFGDCVISSITEDDCLAFRAKMGKSHSPAYANLVIELFRTLMAVAHKRREIAEDPWTHVKRIKVAEQTFDYWTPHEQERFLNVARREDPLFATIVTVALNTGLRWGELYALRRRHLDFKNRRIIVTANYRPSVCKFVETTKTKTVGTVPMNDDAFEALKFARLMGGDDLVLNSAALGGAAARVKSLAKMAEVKRIRFHDLRHTFASSLALAGVDIYTIQRLMRHTSIQTTQRYAHLCESHLALATQRLCATRTPVPDLAPMTDQEPVDNSNKTEIQGSCGDGPLVKWNLFSPLELA